MATIRKIVRARELPRDWSKSFRDPDQPVRVVISEIDPELERAPSLSRLMDIIGERAQKRGLTPELLDDILHDKG